MDATTQVNVPAVLRALVDLAMRREIAERRDIARCIARGKEPHPFSVIAADRYEYLFEQGQQALKAHQALVAERDALRAQVQAMAAGVAA